jgi:hypothetical protein
LGLMTTTDLELGKPADKNWVIGFY